MFIYENIDEIEAFPCKLFSSKSECFHKNIERATKVFRLKSKGKAPHVQQNKETSCPAPAAKQEPRLRTRSNERSPVPATNKAPARKTTTITLVVVSVLVCRIWTTPQPKPSTTPGKVETWTLTSPKP